MDVRSFDDEGVKALNRGKSPILTAAEPEQPQADWPVPRQGRTAAQISQLMIGNAEC